MNVTYAAPGEENTQLPDGTQPMIGSYQVTGVAEFAKKMEDEGKSRWTALTRMFVKHHGTVLQKAFFLSFSLLPFCVLLRT